MRKNVARCLQGGALLLSVTAGISPIAAQVKASGRAGGLSVATLGQRQTRDATVSVITPTGRVNGRIPSRIQSRIRNRIDQNYNPQADTASSFSAAQDQVRLKKR